MKFFDCDRSSAAYRVRIALDLKGLRPTRIPIDIHGPGATHREPAYAAINPQRLVPALALDDGRLITQSLAIIEFIDEVHSDPSLLPSDAFDRALARSIALAVATDIHPFGTPRVAKYLHLTLGVPEGSIPNWVRHWVKEGLQAVDTLIGRRRIGPFAAGREPSVADVFLLPQVAVAERLEVDLAELENVRSVVAQCRRLPSFVRTAPGALTQAA